MKIQGFIFDMDGTMVDNMMVHHRAWQRKLAELGLEMNLEEVRQSIHGINEEILERLFGERFSLEERKRISSEKEAAYREIFLPELKLLDGLSDFLQSAFEKGIVMGVGTAAPIENVDFVLDHLNIRHYFKAVIHAGLVSKGKPDPEVWKKVAEGMDLNLEHCLVFEDSPTGTEAARRAGCPTYVVTTTHMQEEFAQFPNIVGFLEDFTTISIEEILQGVYFYK
ncbi:MAG: HAD-IA family hydrolase [Saprospiraceae bacterium]|nr:HAD-IA family hydrolase [Saprospiraceae bacterium]